ncbi:penicillin binding protein PBP4B [Paraglaciecola sp. 2405UD69-4]|uniref:penicillin binding protein PBP4B n=1 Tax=Paraglaciecola sp. 2405UD69-4 TaxID=3391836 RepID=UPI0039C9130A
MQLGIKSPKTTANKGSLPNRNWLIAGLTLFIVSCTSLPLSHMQSKNYSQRIKFLVMHYTAIDYQESVTALVDEGGLSAHYLIPESNDPSYQDKELKVIQLVDETGRAWHAGRSYWQGRKDLNDHSLGIEIVNVPECMRDTSIGEQTTRENDTSRLCVFPDYDSKQIELLISLSKDILARNPDISPTAVVGHSDISPTRKNDPGPRFPWYQLYQHGIGAWYDNDTLKKYWEMFNSYPASVGLVQQALGIYGYGIVETGVIDGATIDTLSAFQMHFLPWSVNGKLDSKTAGTLFALIDKYFPKRVEALLERYEQEKQPAAVAKALGYYQVNDVFPNTQRSTREWVNDRTIFKSYANQGQIIIDNVNATSADIYVNGQKLNIEKIFKPYHSYQYSLAKRTKNGENTLRVENVLPEGSTIRVMIPYPELTLPSAINSVQFSKVDQLINNDIDAGFPGAVLLVLKDGKIIKKTAYGYARKFADGGDKLPHPIEMQPNQIFDLASNTKMFATNLALMKLVSEGKIDVTRPINDYLPEYQGQGRESRLVRDLLTHSAGYSPQVRFFTKDNALGPQFFSQNKKQTEHLLLSRVPFETGRQTKTVYSDTDYMLLSLLIERITKEPLDLYVEQQIYHPLGLDHTLFNPLQKGFTKSQFAATEIMGNTRGGTVSFDNVRSYVLQGEVHDEKAFHSFAGVAGHAGLFSTVDDLAVLAQTLLNGGGYGKTKILEQSVLDEFIKPEEGEASFGLGWRRAAHGEQKWHFGPYASASAYGHTGWTGTVTVIDPEYDLAVILLTNARHSEIVERENDKGPEFKGKLFETGKYGSVVSLVYEAVLDNQ